MESVEECKTCAHFVLIGGNDKRECEFNVRLEEGWQCICYRNSGVQGLSINTVSCQQRDKK